MATPTLVSFADRFAKSHGKGERARAESMVIAYRAASVLDVKHSDIATAFNRAAEKNGLTPPKGTSYVGHFVAGATAVAIVGPFSATLSDDAVRALNAAWSAATGRIKRDVLAGIAETHKGTRDYAAFTADVRAAIKSAEDDKRNPAPAASDIPAPESEAEITPVHNDADSALADFRAVIKRASALLDILADGDAEDYETALGLATEFAALYVAQ